MQVFFSYAKKDKDFALKLASDLRNAGVDLWIDQLDIRPGDHWDSAIEAALRQCLAFLIVLSPRSVASRNVRDEVSFAIEEGKKIVPIMHETCDLPLHLRRLQYVDFASGYDAAFAVCRGHLQSLFGTAPSAEPPMRRPGAGVLQSKSSVSAIIVTQSRERLDGIRILWVDDQPSNNRYERSVLEQLGAEIHLAIDTHDAILIAKEQSFDFVISDMGRPSGDRAGYALLSALRRMNLVAPFFLYTGSNAPKHQREAVQRGAVGSTNNPHELLEMILGAAPRLPRR